MVTKQVWGQAGNSVHRSGLWPRLMMARKVHNNQAGLSQDISMLVEVWIDKAHSGEKGFSRRHGQQSSSPPLLLSQGITTLRWVEMGLLGPVGVGVAGSSSWGWSRLITPLRGPAHANLMKKMVHSSKWWQEAFESIQQWQITSDNTPQTTNTYFILA